MVIVVVAERPSILNEEARGAVAQSLVHLGQRERYLAHLIEFALAHMMRILRTAGKVDILRCQLEHYCPSHDDGLAAGTARARWPVFRRRHRPYGQGLGRWH